ncbi:stonustoxin subunit beta-like [Clinocottus analis]|uniref:stonustoxin subunit beta-like n=1 Tax=Clinocottus analis TaxID=304258 RepID=UPI0035C085BC
MTAVDLLKTLDDLNKDEFKRFKWHLKDAGFMKPYTALKVSDLEEADRPDIVDLMVKTFEPDGALEATRKVLKEIRRKDLQRPDTSSGPRDVMVLGVPASSHQDKVQPAGPQRLRAGLRKYSCDLTIDTNTVNRYLELSDNNRKVTHVDEKQTYPDHPDRFSYWKQLLCETGLTGRCYWEVEWSGGVNVAVSYRGIRRKGGGDDCWFGMNDQSWSLSCSDRGYSVYHNNTFTSLSPISLLPSFPSSGRVAVDLDCPAGSLSFYRVSDTLIHLHTFRTTFTEALYPGFRLHSGLGFMFGFMSGPGSSVSLCSLEEEESPAR